MLFSGMAKLRSVIIALIILGAGIFAIQRIGETFLKQPGLPTEVGGFSDLITRMRGLTDLILMGIGALIVILIIYAIIHRLASRKPALPAAPAAMPAEAAAREESEEAEESAEEADESGEE